MSIVVQKFGGTSVANAERITSAARRAIRAKHDGNRVVVVVSARGDTTDDLIALASEISDNPPAREMDMLLATGEQISIALMAMAIQQLGEAAVSFTGIQVGIRTDSSHTKARIKAIDTDKMLRALESDNIVIVAGFQGVDEQSNITTLGRGGSDTTAVALAAALKLAGNAVACEIYTDVDGVYTTDPRLIAEARKMDAICYDEMLELASMGAGVMHSRAIEFAKKYDVPLMVRSAFTDVVGTWIVPEANWMTTFPACGAALAKDEVRVFLESLPDRPGVSHRIFEAIAEASIAVDMIGQSVGSGGKACIGFTLLRNDLNKTLITIRPIIDELGGVIATVEDVAKVSVVGAGMPHFPGIAEKMFAALADEKINVKMITTGEIKITVLVAREDGPKALKSVHSAFELESPRTGAGVETDISDHASTTLHPHRGDPAELAVALARLSGMEDIVVSGVKLDASYGRITVFGLPDLPGNCSRVFEAIASDGILVDMIVQNLTGPDHAELSFTVPKTDLEKALQCTRTVMSEINPQATVVGVGEIAILFVHGVGMRTHTGVARKMFEALASQGINIVMINTSEICISVVVDAKFGDLAHSCIRTAFGLGNG
ncbi:MAG: aspartate kinase [Zavarzinella sp.]